MATPENAKTTEKEQQSRGRVIPVHFHDPNRDHADLRILFPREFDSIEKYLKEARDHAQAQIETLKMQMEHPPKNDVYGQPVGKRVQRDKQNDWGREIARSEAQVGLLASVLEGDTKPIELTVIGGEIKSCRVSHFKSDSEEGWWDFMTDNQEVLEFGFERPDLLGYLQRHYQLLYQTKYGPSEDVPEVRKLRRAFSDELDSRAEKYPQDYALLIPLITAIRDAEIFR